MCVYVHLCVCVCVPLLLFVMMIVVLHDFTERCLFYGPFAVVTIQTETEKRHIRNSCAFIREIQATQMNINLTTNCHTPVKSNYPSSEASLEIALYLSKMMKQQALKSPSVLIYLHLALK